MTVADPGHPIFSGITLDGSNGFTASETPPNITGATDAGNGTIFHRMKLSHFIVFGLIIAGFYFLSKSDAEGLVTVTGSQSFEKTVTRSKKPVLAYFWASW